MRSFVFAQPLLKKLKRLLQGQARRIDTYNLFIDVNIKNLYIVVT